jgi:LysR family transcriptional regulator, chromosome initiation inhibitor
VVDYPALRVLYAVVQSGSFEKAAILLNVTPSAVSQRIKQLEERTGAALIARGNPCTATEQGERLCRHMENVGILETELYQSLPSLGVNDGAPHRVTLHIATNADSLGTWFMEAVAEFSSSSDYLVNVSVDDQDHTADWLQQGKVVAAVTSATKPISGCRSFELGVLRYYATASPAFVDRYFSDGVTPETLSRAPALTFNRKDRLQLDWMRAAFAKEINVPTHWLPSTQSFVEASLLGMGWGMNPVHLVDEHLGAGRLVELLPGKRLDVKLSWQINRIAADRLSALTRTVVEVARRSLIRKISD